MFGIGIQELAIIMVIALLIFGPKRLPELARTVGKGLAEFRRASNDLRQSMSFELDAKPPSRPPQQPPVDPRVDRDAPASPAQSLGAPDDEPEQSQEQAASQDQDDEAGTTGDAVIHDDEAVAEPAKPATTDADRR